MTNFREVGAGVNGFYRNDREGNPLRVTNTNDLDQLIDRYDGNANLAISIYTYTKDHPDPIERHKNIIFDVIAFDFDGDLDEVKKDLVNFKEKFLDQLDMEALFVFTGGRGFHVYVYFKTFNPQSQTKAFLRHVQKTISEECKLKTVDPQTFGDTARLFRVPGTRHLKTGLYCIPLTQDEAINLDIGTIKMMAQSPRALPTVKEELKEKNVLFNKWLEYMDGKIYEDYVHEKTKRLSMPTHEVAKWFTDSKEACQGITIALEGAKEGCRDNTLVGLIYYLKMKGLNEEEAYDILSTWAGQCEGHIYDSTIRYKISYHYKRGKMYPCSFLQKCGYCEGCAFNKGFFRTSPSKGGR